MDQASALLAASCERNPAAPRTSSSCSRFEDRSQTGALPPARLDPQSAPHVAPSSRDPRPSSPALCSTQRDICCRIFTPAQPEYPAASVRIIAPALTSHLWRTVDARENALACLLDLPQQCIDIPTHEFTPPVH